MSKHIPVLLHEVIDGLALQPNDIVVDLTLGRAGHSQEILKLIPAGHLYAFDQDIAAISEANVILKQVATNYTIIHANFTEFVSELLKRGITTIDKIVGDLGVSSPQFDEGSRGFSYRVDAELDMRMDQTRNTLTAKTIVNTYTEKALTELFYKYAEHAYSRIIAKHIVKARTINPINTTFELVDIIKGALPNKELRKKGHPAKTIFQALRIAVNDELNALSDVLDLCEEVISENGRIAIITFHSLEDRIVKQKFKKMTTPKVHPHPLSMPSDDEQAEYTLINKKPIIATAEEIADNPRASSAKLRIITKRRT